MTKGVTNAAGCVQGDFQKKKKIILRKFYSQFLHAPSEAEGGGG